MDELGGAVLDTPELDTMTEDTLGDESVDEGLDVPDESQDDAPDDAAEDDDLDKPDAPEDDPNATPPADGRKMPDGLKKAIASLKETNPSAAKEIKGLYWANQEYANAFAKPADAVAAKNLIEEVGGPEGIQQIAAEREEWNGLDASYAEAKPEFAKSIADSNPEAFIKNVPHMINEFASRAPDQYGYYANTVSLNTLAATGISIDNLARAYHANTDKPEVQAIIADVHNALVGLKEKTTQFESKRTDPREEQLKQKETAFEEKRRADFEGGVASQAEKYLADKMKPELDRVIGNRKVDPDAMKGYQKMVNDKVMEMLAEVPNFANNLEAHYRTGDSAKSVAYISAQYNRILPTAVKVIEPYLRNIGAAPAKKAPIVPSSGKPASPGEVTLKEMPEWSDVDQSKTTVADLIMGNAILKNGKRATGWA